MSLDRYRQSLALLNLRPNEIQWFPKWLGAYAGDHQVKRQIAPGDDIPVEWDLVIGFLRNLRDNQVQAWRRLQAARAIEIYQTTVLRTSVVDFRPIRDKLTEIASREKRADGGQQYDPHLVDGEGNPGALGWIWRGILSLCAGEEVPPCGAAFGLAVYFPILSQES